MRRWQNLTTGQVQRIPDPPQETGRPAPKVSPGRWPPEQTSLTTVKFMAKTCLIVKQKRKPKFAVRGYNRCSQCGRDSGYIRYFGICRCCFREMSHKGLLPGVVKSSW